MSVEVPTSVIPEIAEGAAHQDSSDEVNATHILDSILGEVQAWQRQANCMGVDPDLIFPAQGASTREAKEVCRGCVVREDCLEYALANGEKFGIWGGLSERQRRRIRRQRASERRTASTVIAASNTEDAN